MSFFERAMNRLRGRRERRDDYDDLSESRAMSPAAMMLRTRHRLRMSHPGRAYGGEVRTDRPWVGPRGAVDPNTFLTGNHVPSYEAEVPPATALEHARSRYRDPEDWGPAWSDPLFHEPVGRSRYDARREPSPYDARREPPPYEARREPSPYDARREPPPYEARRGMFRR